MVAKDVEALAHTYCRRGVPVQFKVYSGDDHTEAAVPFEGAAFSFLSSRLNGASVSNGCSSIGVGNSLAPTPIPPALTLSVVGKQTHGWAVKVASTDGPLLGAVITLFRGSHQVVQRPLGHLTTSKRMIVLSHKGRPPGAGRYRLTIRQGGLILFSRMVRIR